MFDEKRRIGTLSLRERELAAIGAAIASNCVPCIEYHIPQARKAGLSDAQIRQAVELADKVRRVPEEKVLQTAFALIEPGLSPEADKMSPACGCSGGEANTDGRSREELDPHRVQLENRNSTDDNGKQNKSGTDRAGECCSRKESSG